VVRLRRHGARTANVVLTTAFTVIGFVTVFGQEIHDAQGVVRAGYRQPDLLTVLTVLGVCLPIASRRRAPLASLAVAATALVIQLLVGWPEGALPLAVLFLTYNVGDRCSVRTTIAAVAAVWASVVMLELSDSPSLHGFGAVSVCAQFAAAAAIGIAVRNWREAADARMREVDERAAAEHEQAARMVVEERLRIAQELHDVVAHAMSVIAVQAGVGAHVLDDRPEQAREALEVISATSRGALTDMRRLLGVLRDADGERSAAPAPGLADLPGLVDDVHRVGVPVTLRVDGTPERMPAGLELTVFRVVQESLTNVIKHAGNVTRVAVVVRHEPGKVAVEVVDDGRGLAARRAAAVPVGSGQGLLGMRERVELWGGELSAGPVAGGGYRVAARLPYGGAT
jgi:signal transduction histidine kinase